MNVLIVHYSFTGTCRRIGEALQARFGWAAGEITDAVPGRGNWRCVLDSLLRRRPSIRYAGPAIRSFDTVVLVAPIWVYRLAGPMRAFVTEHRGELPSVVLVTAMGGRGAPNALAEVTDILGRPPALFLPLTTREVEDGSFVERLEGFRGDIAPAGNRPRTPHREAIISTRDA